MMRIWIQKQKALYAISTPKLCKLYSSTLTECSRLLPSDGLTLSDFLGSPAPLPTRMATHQPSVPPKGRVFLETHGCQMNVSDSEIVLSVLSKDGYALADNIDSADVILVNTCAIRENAEAKIWQRLSQLRAQKKKKKTSPPIVGVLGCMAERLKERLLEKENLVDIVVGPDAYRDLPRLLDIVTHTSEPAINVQLSADETYADIAPVRQAGAVSAYVSISRGCNNLCSFCIVPYTRGRERSRSSSTIVDEVKRLVDQGIKEVTLLGQNVNSYADYSSNINNTTVQDGGGVRGAVEPMEEAFRRHYAAGFSSLYRPQREGAIGFAQLLDTIASIDPELRVRFTSPHPKDFTDDVLDVMASRFNVCKQVHCPAQSGSSRILSAMRRGHTREAYDALVERIQERLPGVALSTDMIAGFCGETEQDHEESIELLRSVRYEQAFLFHYSDRERTHAARHLRDDVPLETKLRRLQELISVYRDGLHEAAAEEVGRRHLVLIEGQSRRSAGQLTGRTDTFKRVVLDDLPIHDTDSNTMVSIKPGDYVSVQVTGATGGTLFVHPVARTTQMKYYYCSM